MNDLTLIVCLYKALGERAKMSGVDSWGLQRVFVQTQVKQNGNYYFCAGVIKDISLVACIPVLFIGSYDEVNAKLMTFNQDPTTQVDIMTDTEVKTMFDNQITITSSVGNNMIKAANRSPIEILGTAIDNALHDYQLAMATFINQYPGQTVYGYAMLLPSWNYSSNHMYKPFGSTVFTSGSGIDIVHKGIEINGGQTQYINDIQLSGEVVRVVKHDNIV